MIYVPVCQRVISGKLHASLSTILQGVGRPTLDLKNIKCFLGVFGFL